MNETILVAEDQAHIRALIEFKLKNAGYKVISVDNGEAAMKMAIEMLPNLILLDIMMPLMTGFEVLAALKQKTETERNVNHDRQ